MASIPVAAVTETGIVFVNSGSAITSEATILLSMTTYLMTFSVSIRALTLVISLEVPAVVPAKSEPSKNSRDVHTSAVFSRVLTSEESSDGSVSSENDDKTTAVVTPVEIAEEAQVLGDYRDESSGSKALVAGLAIFSATVVGLGVLLKLGMIRA